ncbi:hypothetical protein DENSPDRAFT_527574 [Dentipellis sp. KUC8613]|nr:hypothetical protein DENSPDRAFT_527574 [Dentipellis sp. KUC8613]
MNPPSLPSFPHTMFPFRNPKDPQRLHSSPSLPNLWVPAHQRPPPASPDASPPATAARFPTTAALHSKFGPLDLAAPPESHPQKIPLAIDALTSPVRSSHASPRRPPLPLTPPLTPSSSLNETLSAVGQPVTPTDAFTEPGTRWRAPYAPAKQPRRDHGQNVISLDDDDDDGAAFRPKEDDRTPTELSASVGHEAPLSRFLLVRNVPRLLSQKAVRVVFDSPGNSDSSALKGIWAGHLQTMGIIILVFYDIRASECARRRLSGKRVRVDEGGEDHEVELRAEYLSLDDAKKLTPRGLSAVTEIEAETAFFLQLLSPQTADLVVVRDILASFGKLLAFRETDGRGEVSTQSPCHLFLWLCVLRVIDGMERVETRSCFALERTDAIVV